MCISDLLNWIKDKYEFGRYKRKTISGPRTPVPVRNHLPISHAGTTSPEVRKPPQDKLHKKPKRKQKTPKPSVESTEIPISTSTPPTRTKDALLDELFA